MTVIGSYEDVFAPRFMLEADNSLAEDMYPYITKFEYEDDEKKFDKLILHVANPGMRFMDDPRFKDGIRYRCRFGYLNDMSEIKNVIIAHARPHYDAKMPVIEMVALDVQHALNRQANPKNWGAISSSDVAKKIADRYKFDAEIEPSGDARAQHRIQTANESDIQYLMTLAKTLNWDCFVEGTKLHFHPKRYDLPSSMTFTYFTEDTGTLLSFVPDVRMSSLVGVSKTGTDPKTGETNKGQRLLAVATTKSAIYGSLFVTGQKGARGFGAGAVNGPVSYTGGVGLAGSTPETDPKTIALHGDAVAQKVDMAATLAEAEIVGTPRAKVRTIISIAGVDQQYATTWRISRSRHIIDSKGPYKTTLHLTRDDSNKKKTDVNSPDTDANKRRLSAVYTTKAAIAPRYSK